MRDPCFERHHITSHNLSLLLTEASESVTLRSRWTMGVLRWCRRETASQVSQKICSTSASVKPVCSLWFIRLTTCPPAEEDPARYTESQLSSPSADITHARYVRTAHRLAARVHSESATQTRHSMADQSPVFPGTHPCSSP